MPTTGSHRIRPGTYPADELTTDYEVEQFIRADDQPGIIDWFEPLTGSDIYSEVAEYVDALDGSRGGFGGGEFSWRVALLTPGMVQHWRDDIFGGADYVDCTAMTERRDSYDDHWFVVNARAIWADLRRDAEVVGTGYILTINFINAVEAAAT